MACMEYMAHMLNQALDVEDYGLARRTFEQLEQKVENAWDLYDDPRLQLAPIAATLHKANDFLYGGEDAIVAELVGADMASSSNQVFGE